MSNKMGKMSLLKTRLITSAALMFALLMIAFGGIFLNQHLAKAPEQNKQIFDQKIALTSPLPTSIDTPTPNLSPTLTPKPISTPSATKLTSSNSLIDCTGPDGKHFQTTPMNCYNFNKTWNSSYQPQATVVNGKTSGEFVSKDGKCLTAEQIKSEVPSVNPAYVYQKPNDPCGYYLPPAVPTRPAPAPYQSYGFGLYGGVQLYSNGNYLYGTDQNGDRVTLWSNGYGGYYGNDTYGNHINLQPNSMGGYDARSSYGNSFQVNSNQIGGYTSY